MAATRKSAKRSSGKKRGSAKRSSARKSPGRKAASKRRAKGSARKSAKRTNLKRKAQQGLRVAKGGINTVRQAGEKTWEALKSTTAHVVEGVRDRLGDDSDRNPTYR